MSVTVHPSAIVEPGAELGDGVRVGPWCRVASRPTTSGWATT